MQNIVCFGDSNTWGYDPTGTAAAPYPIRHGPHVRWTGALAAELGADYKIIEEGQNGRTTVHEDPTAWAGRNGRAYLPACLESHKPLDLVILMLGTNDLKTMFALSPAEIAASAGLLVRIIQESDAGLSGEAPKVLLLCPPAIGELDGLPELAAKLVGAREKSLQFPRYYREVASQRGVEFFDTQPIVTPSEVDGIHFEAGAHIALGRAIAAKVKEILP